MGAVRAPRRDGKSEPLPVFRSLVEIADHHHDMVDSNDVLECHSAVSLTETSQPD
jgi:hypothetical protein